MSYSLLRLSNESTRQGDNPQSSTMACVAGEDRAGDRMNLEKQVNIHHDQQDQQRHLCDERRWIEGHKARVKEHVEMSENGHHGCGNYLVKAKPNEGS